MQGCYSPYMPILITLMCLLLFLNFKKLFMQKALFVTLLSTTIFLFSNHAYAQVPVKVQAMRQCLM